MALVEMIDNSDLNTFTDRKKITFFFICYFLFGDVNVNVNFVLYFPCLNNSDDLSSCDSSILFVATNVGWVDPFVDISWADLKLF